MSGSSSQSRLYVGSVAHERTRPRTNRFRYGLYFIYVDLAELDELDRSLRFFSVDRPNVVTFRTRDHGPRNGSPLRPWIDDVLSQAGIDLEGGAVRILTFPRVLGLGFFPVAFWYCFHADGTPRAVLAEVNNTFGDHHNYLLHASGEVFDWDTVPESRKMFHVSPFIEMDARYEFRFSEPGGQVSASIFDYVSGPLLLVAAISLAAQPLSDKSLLSAVARFGPMSLRAWLLIHYQAIKLFFFKRIAYVPRTPAPEEDTTW